MELQVLDPNLRLAGFPTYKSLIWIERWNRVGTCELYAPATDRNLAIIKIGNYLCRSDVYDRYMTCRIVSIKINDDPESGAWITAIGKDAKYYLDQRVNVSMAVFNSERSGIDLENFIWRMLQTGGERRLLKPNGYSLMILPGDLSDVEGNVAQQVLGLSYGRMARQICGYLNAGYAFLLSTTTDGENPTPDGLPGFIFRVMSAADRRNTVVFSRKNKNIGNTTYEWDIRDYANVVYIQNPEVRLTAAVYGWATFTNRVERFLTTSATPNMEYSQIRDALGGTWSLSQHGGNVQLSASDLLVPVLSPWQLSRLQSWQPGGDTTTQDGYFHVSGPVVIATAENIQVSDVSDSTTFTLISTMYDYVQICAGVEYLRDYREIERLDSAIVDNTYEYGADYHLGDFVTVESFGIQKAAQIVEVLECWDENGYHLEPRTEYSNADQE